jgi:hypothetical protein
LTTAIKATLCLSATAALLACVACSGPGNSGLNPPDPALTKEMPWLNGGVPTLDETDPVMPVIVSSSTPYYPPIGQNLTDEGSAPIQDCYKEALYDFAPWVETSEPLQVAEAGGSEDPATLAGLAIRWAGADDNTRGSWRTPGFSTWYPQLANTAGALNPIIWGTPAQSIKDPGVLAPGSTDTFLSLPFPKGSDPAALPIVPQCPGAPPNNYVIHMRGAGFRYYGGNIAHILAGDNYVPPNSYDETDCPKDVPGKPSLCHAKPADGATVDSAGFPRLPTKHIASAGEPYQLGALHTYLDVSGYEGVSFWARRGPESMGTLLVTIADKYTSDDMNRQNETFCRRIFGCYSQCQNGEPCTASTTGETDAANNPVYRCYNLKKGAIPGPNGGVGASSDLLDEAFPRCNPEDPVTHTHTKGSACTFRSTYPDADFESKECRPYTFTSGESGEYCFNADDPPPPSREQRCNDSFTSMLQLSGDWQFYTVPFSDMRQGGYGKIAPEFDLKSVYSVTLGWGPGNMDIYIDNVSLYKTKSL